MDRTRGAPGAYWLTAFMIVVAACGSHSGPPAVTKAATTITKDGGRLHLDWIDIEVPPGAVTSPLTLTASLQSATPVAKAKGLLSDFLVLEPSGIRFHHAVTIAMKIPREPQLGQRLVIAEWLPQESSLQRLPTTTPAPGVRAAQLIHFSSYGLEIVDENCCWTEGHPINELDYLYECCKNEKSIGGIGVLVQRDAEAGRLQAQAARGEASNSDAGNSDAGDNNVQTCVRLGNETNCSFGCRGCTAPEVCCRDFALDIPSFHCFDVMSKKRSYDLNRNCGGCGVDCGQASGDKTTCCEGVCRNLRTDPKNCGDCGASGPSAICASNECCVSGKCQPCPKLSFRNVVFTCTEKCSGKNIKQTIQKNEGHVCGDPAEAEWTISMETSSRDCYGMIETHSSEGRSPQCVKAGSSLDGALTEVALSGRAKLGTGTILCSYDEAHVKMRMLWPEGMGCREGYDQSVTVDMERSGACD